MKICCFSPLFRLWKIGQFDFLITNKTGSYLSFFNRWLSLSHVQQIISNLAPIKPDAPSLTLGQISHEHAVFLDWTRRHDQMRNTLTIKIDCINFNDWTVFKLATFPPKNNNNRPLQKDRAEKKSPFVFSATKPIIAKWHADLWFLAYRKIWIWAIFAVLPTVIDPNLQTAIKESAQHFQKKFMGKEQNSSGLWPARPAFRNASKAIKNFCEQKWYDQF